MVWVYEWLYTRWTGPSIGKETELAVRLEDFSSAYRGSGVMNGRVSSKKSTRYVKSVQGPWKLKKIRKCLASSEMMDLG